MQMAPADVRPSFMKWLTIPVKTFSRVDTITTYCIVLFGTLNKGEMVYRRHLNSAIYQRI
jgi:hypothetical protein